MIRGPVRKELGYCVGGSTAVPVPVVEKIDAEVDKQLRRWKKAKLLSRPPTRSDVVRKILMQWAKWKPPSTTP